MGAKLNSAINNRNIQVVQPQAPEAVEALSQDIWSFLPKGTDTDYIDGLMSHPEAVTVIYHNETPIAYIELFDNTARHYLGKESLEFGGAVHPDYRKHLITTRVAPAVIRKRMKDSGKTKVLTTCHKDNREAQRAVSSLGFKRIGRATWCADSYLYKLKG